MMDKFVKRSCIIVERNHVFTRLIAENDLSQVALLIGKVYATPRSLYKFGKVI